MWLEVSLFVSESRFSFLEWPSPPCYAMGTHIKQCLIEQYRMLLISVSSPYLISGLSLHFGSRVPGL